MAASQTGYRRELQASFPWPEWSWCCQVTEECKQLLLEPSDCWNDLFFRESENVDSSANSLRHFSLWKLYPHTLHTPTHLLHKCTCSMLCFRLRWFFVTEFCFTTEISQWFLILGGGHRPLGSQMKIVGTPEESMYEQFFKSFSRNARES
jgi:hypothetical protein